MLSEFWRVVKSYATTKHSYEWTGVQEVIKAFGAKCNSTSDLPLGHWAGAVDQTMTNLESKRDEIEIAVVSLLDY